MSRITELNDELQAVRDQKAYLIRHGAENTDQRIVDSEEREAELFRKISEEEKRETQETIIAEASDPGSSFSLSVRGFTADFRALTKGEDEYQMASVTTQLYLAEIEHDHESEIKALKDSFNSDLVSANERNASLEDELEQTRADLADVRGKLEVANNKSTDLEMERDSAVKEAEALRKQVEELREQITEKPKVANNLDGAGALAEINARIEAKKIPVYDVKDEFRSQLGTFTTFKYAETGEYGEIIWTSFKSRFRVLTVEEAARFRQEVEEAKQTELESTPETPITPEPVKEQFRGVEPPQLSDAHDGDNMVGNEPVSESHENSIGGGKELTWEQWVEETLLSLVGTVNSLTPDSVLSTKKPPLKEAA